MNPTVDSVYQTAMQLTADRRAELLARIDESLGGFATPEIAQTWADEAERRLEEHRRGEPSIAEDEVMPKLRAVQRP